MGLEVSSEASIGSDQAVGLSAAASLPRRVAVGAYKRLLDTADKRNGSNGLAAVTVPLLAAHCRDAF